MTANTDTTVTTTQTWAEYQQSVNDHFVGLYGTSSDKTPEAGTYTEMSREEWAEFVNQNKLAHTPAITDEMVRAVSNEVTITHNGTERVVSRNEAQNVLNVVNEAMSDLRAVSDTKARKFDNPAEIRAIDAKVANLAELVVSVSKSLF